MTTLLLILGALLCIGGGVFLAFLWFAWFITKDGGIWG